jgi:hypothetical protein
MSGLGGENRLSLPIVSNDKFRATNSARSMTAVGREQSIDPRSESRLSGVFGRPPRAEVRRFVIETRFGAPGRLAARARDSQHGSSCAQCAIMKVDFTSLSRTRLSALPEEDQRIARDIIRRLRSATTPIGNRIAGVPSSYSATLSAEGGVIMYAVEGVLATVTDVLSSGQRARLGHSHASSNQPGR